MAAAKDERPVHDTLEAAITAAKLDADAVRERGFVVVKQGKGFQFYATLTPAADKPELEGVTFKKGDIVARMDHHTGAWVDAKVVEDVVRPETPADEPGGAVVEGNVVRPQDEPYAGGPEYRPV